MELIGRMMDGSFDYDPNERPRSGPRAREIRQEEQHVLLGPGKFLGEMSPLDGGPRSATVVAHTPVRLFAISCQNFSVLLTDAPDVVETRLATLSRRVRRAEERAELRASGAAGS